jgi:hypothetical protein
LNAGYLCEKRLSAGISAFAGFNCPDTRMTLIGGPALMHRMRELEAVHAAWHLDIGEKQRDIGTRLEIAAASSACTASTEASSLQAFMVGLRGWAVRG